MKKINYKFWLGIFGLYTLIGLLNSSAVSTSALAESNKVDPFTLFYEMTGAYCAFAMLPLILFFIRKFPINKNNLFSSMPLHIIFAVITGAIQTLLMWATRDIVFRIMDWGIYNYGIMTYRFMMEISKLFLAYWMVYGVFVILESIKEVQNKKTQNAKLEEQLVSARLQALQMQLNPHFLFNTLNMISSTMYESVSKADTMITNLSHLLRKTLDSENQKNHTLRDEIEKIRIYIDIMEARFQDNLKIKLNIPEEDEILKILVPPFILQPLLENSIKYSQEKLSQVVEIEISAITNSDYLQLIIVDNGPGINEKSTNQINKGVGLSNTEERLQKLYGDNHKFILENLSQGGLKTLIEIPLVW